MADTARPPAKPTFTAPEADEKEHRKKCSLSPDLGARLEAAAAKLDRKLNEQLDRIVKKALPAVEAEAAAEDEG